MRELFTIVGCVLLMILGVIGLMVGAAYAISDFNCNGFQKATGYQVQYTGLSCYALVDGKWVPSDYAFGKKITANVKSER